MTLAILSLAVGLALAGQAPATVAPKPPVRLPPAPVRAGAPAALLVDLRLPKSWRLDQKTPLRWRFTEAWAGFSFIQRKGSGRPPLRIPFSAAAGNTGARLELSWRACRKADCRDQSADYLVVLKASAGEARTEVPVPITP